MHRKPTIIAMDFEGVLIPEIWIAVAEKTGIEKLRLTTREVPDYDALMKGRIRILKEHHVTLMDIQKVIGTVELLDGASDFISWARKKTQVIILTDSFYEFVKPFMSKLEYPTIFSNSLEVDERGVIKDYHLRQRDGKRKALLAFKSIGFEVISIGDSYNDTTMLSEADLGILFRPSRSVAKDFPQFRVCDTYDELKKYIGDYLGSGG
jgi:phosphoserine/homoserine phosphotransferase